MHYYEYHRKSQGDLQNTKDKYPWLFEGNFSDESREVRLHLLHYLFREYGYTGILEKDDLGKPLPIQYNGNFLHWSLSHSVNYVAFIVSDSSTGIDIVEHQERDVSIQDIHSPHEYAILGSKNWDNFYILWSAKESIIKAHGGSIDDMKDIHLKEVSDGYVSHFAFRTETYRIQTILVHSITISHTI